ncbi:unnamed protein product [Amoebophrya sp. A120]|nr:unnamed protein product [Amoebophrya sp. A120]|eukprot:GSA120T00011335001.1
MPAPSAAPAANTKSAAAATADAAGTGRTAPLASNLDVREVGRTIRAELLNNEDVQSIFDKHRGDTTATLRELEERGLVGTLYSTIQRAIAEQKPFGSYFKPNAKPTDSTEMIQAAGVQSMTEDGGGATPAAQIQAQAEALKAMKTSNTAPASSADRIASAAPLTGTGAARSSTSASQQRGHQRGRSLAPTLGGPTITQDLTFLKQMKQKDALHHARRYPVFALHLKRGKAFLDHLSPEEFAGCHLCVQFAVGSRERKTAKPIFIRGPDCVWNQVLQWEMSHDEVAERANLESFHIVVYRHWPDQKVEMISSQELALREGNFVYELTGTEKKHKLVQGLIELEVQYLGGDWPLRPRVLPDGGIEDRCSIKFRNARLRKCFDDLDAFADNIHRHFRKRIDFYAETENGETHPLCSFVRPIDGARALETPLHALRFCSLFPSKRDVLFEKRDHICWHSTEHIFAQNEASSVEKCLLLCGLLVGGWCMEAYVCLGTRSSPLAAASKLAALAGIETGEQEQCCFVLTRGPEEPTIWDPLRAERYKVSDPCSRVTSVEVAFNNEFIYVNPNDRFPNLDTDTTSAALENGLATAGNHAASTNELVSAGGVTTANSAMVLAAQDSSASAGGGGASSSGKSKAPPGGAAAASAKNGKQAGGTTASKSGGANAVGAGSKAPPAQALVKAATPVQTSSSSTNKAATYSRPERRKRMLGFFNIRSSWVEFKNPLPKRPTLDLKWGDRYFSTWNVINDFTKPENATGATSKKVGKEDGAVAPDSAMVVEQTSSFPEDDTTSPPTTPHDIVTAIDDLVKPPPGQDDDEEMMVDVPKTAIDDDTLEKLRVENYAQNKPAPNSHQQTLLPAPAMIPGPLQRSTLGSGNFANQQAFVESRIEDVLRSQFEKACGRSLPWEKTLEPLLGLALHNCETERVQLQSSAAVQVFEEMARLHFCTDERDEMVAFPIQFNDIRYERFFSVMLESSTVQKMVTSTSSSFGTKGPLKNMGFAVRCRIFLYPENVLACWIILAQRTRLPGRM